MTGEIEKYKLSLSGHELEKMVKVMQRFIKLEDEHMLGVGSPEYDFAERFLTMFPESKLK